MKAEPGFVLLAAVALVGSAAYALQARSERSDGAWRLAGVPGAFSMMAAGDVSDSAGATLSLRRTPPDRDGAGSAMMTLPADAGRGRRLRLSADLHAENVESDGSLYGGASLWLRVDSGSRMLLLDETSDESVDGTTTGWVHRELIVPVSSEATGVGFGLTLAGSGSVVARKLRVEWLPPFDPAAAPAPAAARDLDSAIALARTYSLWRDTVSWSVVEPRVRALAVGAATPREVYPAIRALLAALGDHHSLLLSPGGVARFQGGGASLPRPAARTLEGGVGYVMVPAHMNAEATAMRTYTLALHDGLRRQRPTAGCRWVIDLRQDMGGNSAPMLAGLQPFLGHDTVGSWTVRTPAGAWERHEAAFTAADYFGLVGVPAPSDLAKLDSAWVAVLTGPRTGSSGEVVTAAFRGRPRTRSFGEPTAGVSTGNEGYPLPSGARLVLTTAVLVDRAGHRLGGAIAPDERAVADGPGTDRALDEARVWLARQGPCSAREPHVVR